MMQILDNNSIDRCKWDDYIENHQYGTVFHTSYLFDVYTATPNFKPYSFFAVDENGAVIAMLSGFLQTVKSGLASKLSTRSVMLNGPIYTTINALNFLMEYYGKWIEGKAVYTEIRNHADPEIDSKTYINHGFSFEGHLNLLIDLSQSEEELWKKVHSKRRNEIRKAEKNNVRVTVLSPKDIQGAYAILQEVYNRAGLPLLPVIFFETAYNLGNKEYQMVSYGAYLMDELIGIMITLQFKGVVYDLFAGSLAEYYNKNPNDLIPWEVFKLAKDHGNTLFDFGGAGKPNVHYGVRDYKMKFGGSLVNYGRYTKIHNSVLFFIASHGFSIMRKLRKVK